MDEEGIRRALTVGHLVVEEFWQLVDSGIGCWDQVDESDEVVAGPF